MEIVGEILKGLFLLVVAGALCFVGIVFLGFIDRPPQPTSGQQLAPGVDPDWRPERPTEVPPPPPPVPHTRGCCRCCK